MVYGVDSIWTSMGYATVLLIYFLVGKVPSVDIRALIYEGLFLIVSCGEFGENGTQDVFKGMNGQFWSGVRLLIFFLVLISNFLEMLDVCSFKCLIYCFSCTLPVYLVFLF